MTGLSPESRPDTTAIRARAEAATPGPWTADVMGSEGYAVNSETPPPGRPRWRTRVARCGWMDWGTDRANAEFIAGMDPTTTIALLDALDTAERLLVSLLADLTEQYEKAREERDQHDEYSNYWRWLDGICEGLDRAIQRAKYAPDTTTTEPVEPDPFTDNDTEVEP